MANFGVENILVGDIKSDNDGYKLVVELIDILRQTRIFREEYLLRENSERAIAHSLSNAIYKQLIGKVGCYNTKIAYVVVSIGLTLAAHIRLLFLTMMVTIVKKF